MAPYFVVVRLRQFAAIRSRCNPPACRMKSGDEFVSYLPNHHPAASDA